MAPINTLNSTTWKKLSEDQASTCVHLVHKKLHLLLPPFYCGDIKNSIATIIDRNLIHYDADLGGILASYGKITVLGPKAGIMFNLPNNHINVEGDFYIFNPSVGCCLTGIVNKKSAGHIGCLVHGLFNISLPKPWAVPAHSWIGSQANLQDEVTFTISRSDLQSQVPYIEGTIIEIKSCQTETTTTRERKCSDSGVSICSEEGVSSKKAGNRLSLCKAKAHVVSEPEPPAATVECPTAENETLPSTPVEPTKLKKKRKSDSIAIDEPKTPAVTTKSPFLGGPEPDCAALETPVVEPSKSKKKRKRDSVNDSVSVSVTPTTTEAAPRKKSKGDSEAEDDENEDAIMDMVSSLFSDASKALKSGASILKTSSKKTKVKRSESDSESFSSSQTNTQSVKKKKKSKTADTTVEDAESIIKELISSVHKSTPLKTSLEATKKSKKKLSLSRLTEEQSPSADQSESPSQTEFTTPLNKKKIKKEKTVTDATKTASDKINESLINSILRSVKKK